MSQNLDRIKHALDLAIAEVEGEGHRLRQRLRAQIERREQVLAAIREIHDRVLQLRAAGAGGGESLESEACAELRSLIDRLSSVLTEAFGDATVPEPPPPPVREVVARPRAAAAPATPAPPPPIPAEAPAAAAEPPREKAPAAAAANNVNNKQATVDVALQDELAQIYQEIITLEENHGLLAAPELHQRLDLLLARLRRIQDGPLAARLSDEDRRFMTTRFGLLGTLQRQRGLGYLATLNRRYHADWDEYVMRLSRGLEPISVRLDALKAERERAQERRRAAEAQLARRRLEGEELLDEIRLFLCGPDLGRPEGPVTLRRLVADCGACLGFDHPGLLGLVGPHVDHLDGKDFKPLRRALRKRAGIAEPEPASAADDGAAAGDEAPTSAQADREEALRGTYAGVVGLLLGGQRREAAESILVEHLGLRALHWMTAGEVAAIPEERLRDQIDRMAPGLVIILADSIRRELAEELRTQSGSRVVVPVTGGQRVSTILAAVPRGDRARRAVLSVNDALDLAFRRFPGELVRAFNSASEEKDYPFEDPDAVYKALEFLATTYREARAGRVACPDLDHAFRQACGFSYRAHQSACTVGQYPEAYATTYGGERYELLEHAGRGVGRDPRHSIRIAFTYLPERDAVLVGFLGQHQPTRAS